MDVIIIGFTDNVLCFFQVCAPHAEMIPAKSAEDVITRLESSGATKKRATLIFVNLDTKPWAIKLAESLKLNGFDVPVIGYSNTLEVSEFMLVENVFRQHGGRQLFSFPLEFSILRATIRMYKSQPDLTECQSIPVKRKPCKKNPKNKSERKGAIPFEPLKVVLSEDKIMTIQLGPPTVVRVNDVRLTLTRAESRLVKVLASEPGVHSRRSLHKSVFKTSCNAADLKSIDILVTNVVEKINKSHSSLSPCIKKIWNDGYKLDVQHS